MVVALVGCASASAQTNQRTFFPIAARDGSTFHTLTPVLDGTPTGVPGTASPTLTPTASPTGSPDSALSATVSATPTAAPACGGDRGAVRSLTDQAAAEVAVATIARSVGELRDAAPPTGVTADTPRLQRLERSAFQVRAALVDIVERADGALLVTLADPGDWAQTVVVELPGEACAGASPRGSEIASARANLLATCGASPSAIRSRLYGYATFVGVGFFDPEPGDGAAPNGLGLAPVLRFQSSDCNTFGTSTPTPTITLTPTRTPTPTPTIPATLTPTRTPSWTITPAPNAFSVTGSGSPPSSIIALDPGTRVFRYTYTGAATMTAVLQDSSGTATIAPIVTCPASCSGSVSIPVAGGAYRIKVTSSGNWAFTIQ
jgi:hypothetical protein